MNFLHAAFLPLFILGAVVIAVVGCAACVMGGIADRETELQEREVEEREARDVESGAGGMSSPLELTVQPASPALSCHAERVHRPQRPLLPARRGDL